MPEKGIKAKIVEKAIELATPTEEQAKKVVRKYSLISSAAGLIPINIVDIVTSTISQSLMVKDLCELYGVPSENHMQTVAINSGVGSLIAKGITVAVENFLSYEKNKNKSLDITGAAVAGIYTALIGEYYIAHFQEGGTLEDVEIGDIADFFIEELKRGDLDMGTLTNPVQLVNRLIGE